ncbi:MAG TPA: Stp1/IreP family PP2C-type Ser/Thr phosphatase [Armatimonadota bacterium]|nr:Stp1/IreP family PP2C-type Ser/Thr phosphatase [Armatimonadota bacterium]
MREDQGAQDPRTESDVTGQASGPDPVDAHTNAATGSSAGASVVSEDLSDAAEIVETPLETAPGEEERETTAKLSIQELTAGWKDLEEQKPELSVTIRFGAKTNLGRVRENNEDKFDFFVPEQTHILAARGCLYAVADGMGGHAAGQIASEYALNVVIRAFYSDTQSDLEQALRSAIEQANLLIHEAANAMPDRNQMGTTLTCAVIREDDLYIGQVGDSRGYLFREGELRQITEDHSWVAEQVKRGAMTPEEAECSPFRNYITRSLGTVPEVEVDIYHEKLQEDDVILLCSDGLSGMISDAEIADTLANRAPSLSTLMLVEQANSAGGRDNVTAVVLQIQAIEPFEKKKGFRWPGAGKPARK